MSAKVQADKYLIVFERSKACSELISNDVVALGTGSGRGSIKKPRPACAEPIVTINVVAKQRAEVKVASDPMPGMRKDIEDPTRRLDQSLDKEAALLHGFYNLRAKAKQLAEENRLLKLGRFIPV